jgi:2-isopropylmalate synthase
MSASTHTMPVHKYAAYTPINLPDRRWPGRVITKAPQWCSVDLRDGNQALIEPMGSDRKMRMYELLIRMGFKEIEIGFPSASQTDFDFCRQLIDEKLIPDDVTIQVLTQAREELIRKTFDAIRGSKRAVVHVYNSTSTLQRRVVFGMAEDGIKALAVDGVKLVKSLLNTIPDTEVVLEYSPESFTGTELPFAKEICEAVMEAWGASPKNKVILNLPATVEMATPNVYADQIEWFDRNVKNRDSVILSVHPHNDRGTGVAAAELALMAGADRVEGTLFGNGERTGNVDIVTLGLNMFTQGVDPQLDLHDVRAIVDTVEYCNQLPVHPRHPYGGDLVFTAFSGSHQDAIKKGLAAIGKSNSGIWEVPYLPIDPADVGRQYEPVIRVNSQSGKGGVAFILHTDHDFDLPKGLQAAFSKTIQEMADATGKEISSDMIWNAFQSEYLEPKSTITVLDYRYARETGGSVSISADLRVDGQAKQVEGSGNGPIDGYVSALNKLFKTKFDVVGYHEQIHGTGASAQAVTYMEISAGDGKSHFGVAVHPDIVTASLHAVTRAFARALGKTGK